LMWSSIPQSLCELDFSNLSLPPQHTIIFEYLFGILSTNQTPLALHTFNISKVLAIPQTVTKLLEVLLLSPMIRLNKLDISGCMLTDLVLNCLGYCLRRNRTLSYLRFDGQGATAAGYFAFRGCLYGNKKLVDVSYPYGDVTRFFAEAKQKITELQREAASYQPQISAAYRSRNHAYM